MHARSSLALVVVVVLGAACGGNSSSNPDAAPPDAEGFHLCGNFMLEAPEECDDGNQRPDDGCSADCTLECGDGQVTGAEQCDISIATGTAGACPTEATCTDNDPCTTGVVSGAGCDVTCEFATTTATIDGDGCCPAGADATTDNDCTALCGNGVVEGGETCDTAIAAGNAGACPTACDDGQNCTTDALANGGTCTASCSATPIVVVGPVDGCCPAGANPNTDGDCQTGCGDGVVSGGESCDIAIAAGNAGACPTSCNDGNVCTADALVNAGTCNAGCVAPPIGAGPADGCCPNGADLGDDPDCPPSCGDGVITPPETCDDNNANAGDGCSATCRVEAIAFRFSDMDLRDPHTFATVPILGCADVTNLDFAGNKGVNPTLQLKLQGDGDGDGLLDLSLAETFAPLVQSDGASTPTDLVFPDCSAPLASTSCQLPADAGHSPATATNHGNNTVCLAPLANTVNTNYTPALVNPTAPNGGTCYEANAGTISFSLGQIPITLIDTHIGGEWFGSPATEIRDGMIRGFFTQALADATIIPEGTTGIDSIDGSPVSYLLKGGANNCKTAAPAVGDMDTYTAPDGSMVKGWWFYLNFTAAKVGYSEL